MNVIFKGTLRLLRIPAQIKPIQWNQWTWHMDIFLCVLDKIPPPFQKVAQLCRDWSQAKHSSSWMWLSSKAACMATKPALTFYIYGCVEFFSWRWRQIPNCINCIYRLLAWGRRTSVEVKMWPWKMFFFFLNRFFFVLLLFLCVNEQGVFFFFFGTFHNPHQVNARRWPRSLVIGGFTHTTALVLTTEKRGCEWNVIAVN